MKKDLLRKVKNTSKVALGFALLIAGTHVLQAREASEQLNGLQVEVPAYGRAILTVEDMQTLLGVKTRDPSSQGLMLEQEVQASAITFDITLSPKERGQILRALMKVEKDRAALAKQLQEEETKKVAELRKQRRQIQFSRTHTRENSDLKLGRDLFSSLLAEANAGASIEETLKAFDQKNAVRVQYKVQEDGQRHIALIRVGTNFVWKDLDQNKMVAQR